MSHNFAVTPTIHAPRSRFHTRPEWSMSMNVGTLYPIASLVQPVYPGDTWDVDLTIVNRVTSSFLRPVCDNLVQDVYFFFVPWRLCYEDIEQVFGFNSTGPWAQATEVSVPVIPATSSSADQVAEKSVADYLGIQPGYFPGGANIMPFRAFALIYRDWFQSEAVDTPMHVYTGARASVEVINSNPWSPSNYFGMLPRVNKLPNDCYTTALPSTQKGAAAGVSLTSDSAPVVAGASHLFGGKFQLDPAGTTMSTPSMLYIDSNTAAGSYGYLSRRSNNSSELINTNDWSVNMVADLSNAGIMSIPDIRNAFALQRILERSARSGNRMQEYILSAFNVLAPDQRMMKPEYLGGKRIPLSVQQVAQTTRTDSAATQLGSLGAFSLSNGKCGFTKSFTEHGYIFAVTCIRQLRHTVSQGIPKHFQRVKRFDFYDPALAYISEQPVYQSELYSPTIAHSDIKDGIFGYQEAWYDLRDIPNGLAGDMRPTATNSLDIWHFGDDYAGVPVLNSNWLKEGVENVDRTLAVKSVSGQDQFFINTMADCKITRRLPAYSIPGLIDHH